jgi:hypothetical protein
VCSDTPVHCMTNKYGTCTASICSFSESAVRSPTHPTPPLLLRPCFWGRAAELDSRLQERRLKTAHSAIRGGRRRNPPPGLCEPTCLHQAVLLSRTAGMGWGQVRVPETGGVGFCGPPRLGCCASLRANGGRRATWRRGYAERVGAQREIKQTRCLNACADEEGGVGARGGEAVEDKREPEDLHVPVLADEVCVYVCADTYMCVGGCAV